MGEITLVDYGLGNIHAFANIYRRLNVPAEIASTADTIRRARRLILPGVGAFDWAMQKLQRSGLREALDERVMGSGVPVLGVCVGMQMMAKGSDEGVDAGLGWIDADVRKFAFHGSSASPLPHMGWNEAKPVTASHLFANIDNPRFYFLHSYCVHLENGDDLLATADYAGEFVAAFKKDNVFGTQFHPEKSHGWGIQLLHNFCRI